MCFIKNIDAELGDDKLKTADKAKTNDCYVATTTTASNSDEMLVVEASPFRPDAYAEDGTPIVFIN